MKRESSVRKYCVGDGLILYTKTVDKLNRQV